MMSHPIADEFDAIRARLAQLREEAIPRCPMLPTQTLHECLRSSSRCNNSCPNHGDWIGDTSTSSC